MCTSAELCTLLDYINAVSVDWFRGFLKLALLWLWKYLFFLSVCLVF